MSMKRRKFITLLGGAAAWPLAARGQQPGRMRRVGVLMRGSADDPDEQARLTAFLQGLQESGWSDSHNVQIDVRWSAADSDRRRRYAAELIALSPDAILADTSAVVAALQQATQTVPIVFAGVIDPVGAGFVANLARPGGNTTGFASLGYGTSGKWLELLKEIAPRVTRAGVLRDPTFAAGIGQLAAIQAVAPALGLELSPLGARDRSEIEREVAAFAPRANAGLIVTAAPSTGTYRDLIIALAARHRMPAVYPFRYHVSSGGLISYGPDSRYGYRPAASYIDRILKGEQAGNLPVQEPTKFDLVINLKTAKAMGLELPTDVLARADEVIE
jgi:putative tryptophan/tyrosine transport system substrate-binding protein